MRDPALVCTACSATFPITSLIQRCAHCHEPIEVAGDVRGAHVHGSAATLLERFRELLPSMELAPHLSLGEGGTPLARSRQIESLLKVNALSFKVEGLNPTGSFKDRGTIAGIAWATTMGIRRVGAVSTGNMGGSVAAYAARAGLPCTVITSPETPPSKLGSIGVHRPRLVQLSDGYGDAYETSIRLRESTGTYFINSDDPFRVEGQKTLGFEILEQCGDAPPDLIVLPVSSGGNAVGLLKSFQEWSQAGLGDCRPRLLCVQSSGCAPIANAFDQGVEIPAEIDAPNTIAHSISNPRPPSGARLLRALSGGQHGWVISVSDREIEAAQSLLAEEEGLLVQPDSAASLAGLTRALRRGLVDAPRHAVLVLTGHGLKDPSAFDRMQFDVTTTPALHLEQLLAE